MNDHKGDLLYNEWFMHKNIIREPIDVRENYKSINVLTMCDVYFMIESMCIN